MKILHYLAKPSNFLRFGGVFCGIMGRISVVLFCIGVPWAFIFSPPDALHGELVRLMYIHVPTAWCSMLSYMATGVTSAGYLVWKHPVASLISEGFAKISALLSALCLVTGMVWGYPAWGTWWVWDMRLTSMLLLFLLSCGILFCFTVVKPLQLARKYAAILSVIGIINLPIIIFSVKWWTTLHQPASISFFNKDSVDIAMKAPLLVMALAFTSLTLYVAVKIAMNSLCKLKNRDAVAVAV